MNLLRNHLVRSPIVIVAGAAWLAVSNHCAIAAMEDGAKVPMAHCHGAASSPHAPAKQDHRTGVECCKVLRATLLTPVTSLAAYDALTFAILDYIVGVLPVISGAHVALIFEWDTGPPGLHSFAESVLQRSILAHAPPVSLS
jgi:hypothetical protein